MKTFSVEEVVRQARAYGADDEAIKVLREWRARPMTDEERLEYRWALRDSQCSAWIAQIALAHGKKPLGVRSLFYRGDGMSINDAVRKDVKPHKEPRYRRVATD
jgi:hypothetical protein